MTMKWTAFKTMPLLLALMLAATPVSAWAQARYVQIYNATTGRYEYVPESQVVGYNNNGTTTLRGQVNKAWQNPTVKSAAVGAAVGAGAGLISGRSSVLKGALVGGAAGAGTGLLNRSQTLQENPGLKRAAQGAIIGAGVGAVSGKKVGKSAAIGAGAGLGWHLLDRYVLNPTPTQNQNTRSNY